MNDKWNPEQYQKFAEERKQPFYDLLSMILPARDISIIDLGCGTGELTLELHEKFQARETIGIDSSQSMLEQARKLEVPGLTFKEGDIARYPTQPPFGLVFSNAALQWIPDHVNLFHRLFNLVEADGQIAFQIPYNIDYPTHAIARQIATEAPFNTYLEKGRQLYVLSPESYSKLLKEGGFDRQVVRQQIYPHILNSTESVIEWVKGTLLTYYQSRLPEKVFEEFLERYRHEIFAYFGDQSPFFFPFKRILIWGKRGAEE